MTALVDQPLFDLPGAKPPLPHEPARRGEKLTPDQARAIRQAATMTRGMHPLGSKLHPDAAPVDDRQAEGLRCRGCVHVMGQGGTNGRYLKCDIHTITRGPGTDLRLWWPACDKRESA